MALVGCATTQPKAVAVPVPPPRVTVAELLDRLSSTDPDLRAGAAWALARAAETPEVRSALEKAADDPSREVRYGAQWALGRKRRPEEVPASLVPLRPTEDTPPRAIHVARPQYPQDAFHKKVTGTVVLEILIGEEGEVAHAEVIESVAGLDAAALDCVKEWRFQPALRAGKPVATVARAPVTFRIF